MNDLKPINMGLRFLLEMAALVSLGYWGFKFNTTPVLKIVLGIGLPLLTAIVWGIFGSPKAAFPFPKPLQWALILAIYLLAALALFDTGKGLLGILFLVAVAINSVLMVLWKQ